MFYCAVSKKDFTLVKSAKHFQAKIMSSGLQANMHYSVKAEPIEW